MLQNYSDTPCIIEIATDIPRSNIFHFENYWMEHEDFMSVVQHAWNIPTQQTDAAKVLSAKFKTLKRVLSARQAQLSSLKTNISNVKLVPHLLEIIEELRDLSIEEWNFKSILEKKLLDLLHQQKIYWEQRDM